MSGMMQPGRDQEEKHIGHCDRDQDFGIWVKVAYSTRSGANMPAINLCMPRIDFQPIPQP